MFLNVAKTGSSPMRRSAVVLAGLVITVVAIAAWPTASVTGSEQRTNFSPSKEPAVHAPTPSAQVQVIKFTDSEVVPNRSTVVASPNIGKNLKTEDIFQAAVFASHDVLPPPTTYALQQATSLDAVSALLRGSTISDSAIAPSQNPFGTSTAR